jgi:outer membrane lipoprotein carrier protein
MRRLVLTVGFFSVTAFVIVTSVHSAAASSSDELARQVEEKYRSLSSLSMDFVKITRSEIFETESKIEGKMLVKNPDRFKIDTEDEIIVCDGKFVWSYSVENQQVIKNLADRSEKVFKPNQYLADFRSRYAPRLTGEEKVDGIRCFVLSLAPKDEEVFIKKMTIWVDKKKLLAKKLEYTDSNDNQVTLIFQRIKTNRKIKDSEFVFQAPPGVEELDLSE